MDSSPLPMEVATVDQRTAFNPINSDGIQPVNPLADLIYIRSLFPFVPIMPIPNAIATVICGLNAVSGNPDATEINFPDGAILAKFSSTSLFYVSFDGNARLPNVADITINQPVWQYRSLIQPINDWFYIGGRRSCSVIAPVDQTIVQAQCYIANFK